MTTLKLGPGSTLTVRAASADALEVEALYGPGGSPPPAHLHPAQAEHFEVLEGSLTTRVDGRSACCRSATRSTSRPGAVHQMWNPGSEPARVLWRTSSGGPHARVVRGARRPPARRPGVEERHPEPLAMSVLLTEYRDVFRLAGPDPVLRTAFAMLAPLGRLRGYSTNRSGIKSASAPPYE